MEPITERMQILTKYIELDVEAESVIDITSRVEEAVKGSNLENGSVVIFVPGSTGAVSTIEYEPGLLKDLRRALEVIAPSNIEYEHHKRWGDDNGRSHVRATIVGQSLVVPFVDRALLLGRWQQIVLLNLDTSRRSRRVVLQITGE